MQIKHAFSCQKLDIRVGHDQTCLPPGQTFAGTIGAGQIVRAGACKAAGLGDCQDDSLVPVLTGDYPCQSEIASAALPAGGRLRAR
jgi:hypothetical protein